MKRMVLVFALVLTFGVCADEVKKEKDVNPPEAAAIVQPQAVEAASQAQSAVVEAVEPKDEKADTKKQAVAAAEKYLNSVTTMQGKFKQLTSQGGYATGAIYVSRPGKIRFDYDPPNHIQLIADGGSIIYYDSELEQVSYLSQKGSIAGVILKDRLSFSDPDFRLEDVSIVDKQIRIALSSSQDPLAGKIILVFAQKPMALVKWQVVDAQGTVTTVLLENMVLGRMIDDKVFLFEDPRQTRKLPGDEGYRRRR